MPIFNSPPGWPTPPPGWTPPQGWQPDPSWPPAPTDHLWWTEDTPASTTPTPPGAPTASTHRAPEVTAAPGLVVPALEPLDDERPARRRARTLVLAGAPAPHEERTPVGGAVPVRHGVAPAPHGFASVGVPTQQTAPVAERSTAALPQPAAALPGLPLPAVAPPAAASVPVLPDPVPPAVDLAALYEAEQRRAGRRAVVLGVLLLLTGLAVAVLGPLAVDLGDTVVMLWGPVALGLLGVVRGAVQMARAQRTALRQVLAPR